jgi:mono/diheme cytochrome c family protein
MPIVRSMHLSLALAAVLGSGLTAQAATPGAADAKDIARGRYVMKIAGCNDCHTPGYAQSGGKVPEAAWLTGDMLGWSGEWGTTYPINLRTYMQGITEAQWIAAARTKQARPPMPWFALRDMSDADLRATYRFIRSLGPAGQPAPAYLPPGQVAKGPVVQFPAAPK